MTIGSVNEDRGGDISASDTTQQVGGAAVEATPAPAASEETTPPAPPPLSRAEGDGKTGPEYGSGVMNMTMLRDKLASGKYGATPQVERAALPTVTAGSKPDDVKGVQKELNEWRAANGKPPIKEDGLYGPKTKEAVVDFQKANGLAPDGIAGPNTRERLDLVTDKSFKKLDAATQKQVLDQMDKCKNDPAARENIAKLARDPNLAALPPAAQQAAVAALGAKPKDGKQLEGIQSLIKAPGFAKLDPNTQTRALGELGKHPGDVRFAANLERLCSDERFRSMSPAEQGKMLTVFGTTTPAGQEALQHLLHKEIAPGKPMLAQKSTSPDPPQLTLLDELERQAKTPLDPKIKDTDKARASEALLKQIDEPGHNITQGGHGTCGATSASYWLAQKNPAEYARLQTDLMTKGEAKLANGEKMTVPADAWQADSKSPGARTPGERLMQSSLFDYAHGGGGHYHNQTDTFDDKFAQNPDGSFILDKAGNKIPVGGLGGEEHNKLLGALFKGEYKHVDGPAFKDPKDKAAASAQVMDTIKKEIEAGRVPVFVGILIPTPPVPNPKFPSKDGKEPQFLPRGVHAVAVTEIREGPPPDVVFRNPWGPNQIPPNGKPQADVGKNSSTVDQYDGRQSLPLGDFTASVTGAHAPK